MVQTLHYQITFFSKHYLTNENNTNSAYTITKSIQQVFAQYQILKDQNDQHFYKYAFQIIKKTIKIV